MPPKRTRETGLTDYLAGLVSRPAQRPRRSFPDIDELQQTQRQQRAHAARINQESDDALRSIMQFVPTCENVTRDATACFVRAPLGIRSAECKEYCFRHYSKWLLSVMNNLPTRILLQSTDTAGHPTQHGIVPDLRFSVEVQLFLEFRPLQTHTRGGSIKMRLSGSRGSSRRPDDSFWNSAVYNERGDRRGNHWTFGRSGGLSRITRQTLADWLPDESGYMLSKFRFHIQFGEGLHRFTNQTAQWLHGLATVDEHGRHDITATIYNGNLQSWGEGRVVETHQYDRTADNTPVGDIIVGEVSLE